MHLFVTKAKDKNLLIHVISIDSNLKITSWSKMPTLTIRMIKHRHVLESGNASKENEQVMRQMNELFKVRRSVRRYLMLDK